MHTFRRTALAAVAALSLLGAAACSDDEDGDGAETDEEVEQLDEQLEDTGDDLEEEIDEGESEVEE